MSDTKESKFLKQQEAMRSYVESENRPLRGGSKSSATRPRPRPSPITGEPMEEIDLHGVKVDRCPTSGGIWLDRGELEQIVDQVLEGPDTDRPDWLVEFFRFFVPKRGEDEPVNK